MSESRRIDWRRKEVGRIHCVAGDSAKERNAFVHLLDLLYQMNQLDTLKAVKEGSITPKELMAEYRAGRHLEIDVANNVRLAMPLWIMLETMIRARHGGIKHKTRMRNSLSKLRASGLVPETATVRDLRKLTKAQLRPLSDSAADFNHMMKAILTPLSQLFGDPMHPFRREILRAIGPKEKEPKRPLDITQTEFWQLVDALPEKTRPAIVALATTGMRLNTEFFRATVADLRPSVPGLFCDGSKTADSKGIIHVASSLYPTVEDAITHRVSSMTLRRHFTKAREAVGLEKLTLHDLRHLTAIFAFEGGAQMNEVQAMLRHADVRMTSRYSAIADRGKAAEAIGRALERPTERAD